MLYVLFFRLFCVFDAKCTGFLMVSAGRPPLVAISVFLLFLCAFDAMCIAFLICFADRPSLVATFVGGLVFLCF